MMTENMKMTLLLPMINGHLGKLRKVNTEAVALFQHGLLLYKFTQNSNCLNWPYLCLYGQMSSSLWRLLSIAGCDQSLSTVSLIVNTNPSYPKHV